MKREDISDAVGNISTRHIHEAADYTPDQQQVHLFKRPFGRTMIAAMVALCLLVLVPLTALAIDIIQYNAAVDYLTSLGIQVKDLNDYSRKEVKEAVKTIEAGERTALSEEVLKLLPNNKAIIDTPTQVTSEQIEALTPTMTRENVLEFLGDTQDIGSGIYIYIYEVDHNYMLKIPFAGDDAQLGVTGDDLLKALEAKENVN